MYKDGVILLVTGQYGSYRSYILLDRDSDGCGRLNNWIYAERPLHEDSTSYNQLISEYMSIQHDKYYNNVVEISKNDFDNIPADALSDCVKSKARLLGWLQ